MSFKTRTTSTTYYEDTTHGSFELPFSGDFYREMLHVSDDGLTAVLGMLCSDQDAEDPFEAFDEGEFCQFDSQYKHFCERPDTDAFKRLIRANPGRVFTHNGTGDWHGPGTTRCSPVAGPFEVSHTKGSTAALEEQLDDAGGYYIVPEDATDPAAYAKSALNSYSAWCNGEVYGVMVWVYSRPDTDFPWELDEESRDSECWGFLGGEYAMEELRREFEERIKP